MWHWNGHERGWQLLTTSSTLRGQLMQPRRCFDPLLQSWGPSLGPSPSHCSPGWNGVTIKPCKQLILCALLRPSKSHPVQCVLSCCKSAHGLPAAETDIILLIIDMRGAVPVHTSWESGLWTTCIEFIGSSVYAHKLCLQCREGVFCRIYSYLPVKH